MIRNSLGWLLALVVFTIAAQSSAAGSRFSIEPSNGAEAAGGAPAAAPTFTGTVTPSTLTLVAGATGEYQATVIPLNGFTDNVTLHVGGVPAGVTTSFAPSVISGGSGSSSLTIQTASTTAPGTYTLTVFGSSTSVSRSLAVTLVVQPPVPDFTGSINPRSVLIGDGQVATYTIQIIPINKFAGNVTLSVTGVPSGATASFNPTIVKGGSGASVLTITSGAQEAPTNNTLMLTGTSGTLSHTTPLGFQVATAADFTGSIAPAVNSALVGGKATYTVTIDPVDGFTADVALSVSGLPAGAAAALTPSTIRGGSGTSSMVITTTGSTPPGAYPLILTGTSATQTHRKTFQLDVNTSVGDFSGSVNPLSQTIAAGASGTYSVNIFGLQGFTGDVTLTLTGLPAGATGSFSPSNVVKGGSGSATLTVMTPGSLAAGKYSFVLIATSGGISHDASVAFVVP